MNAKICKQCGELKPIEQFRKYYGGRKGSYKTCKLCEKINARAKYLEAKGDEKNYDEEAELDKIHRLWEVQRAAGFQPPLNSGNRKVPLVDSLDDMISKYADKAERVPVPFTNALMPPAELAIWLTCELTEDPEYYYDDVYDELKKKYRPQLRIDENMRPVYDDSYKTTLDAILERFTKYEDEYYNKD